MKPFSTFSDVLEHMRANYSNPKALSHQDGQGVWHSESTHSFLEKVRFLALGLKKRGLKKGDRVGIMAKPCPGWTIADFAIVLAGGITVPLFGNTSPENLTFEVEETGLKTLFVEGEAEWVKCTRYRNLFETVISLEARCPDETAVPIEDVLAGGQSADLAEPDAYQSLLAAVRPDEIATIIYTSGSTGRPKGVQLTQWNLVRLISLDPFSWNALKDRYLSFLPLAHIFARILNYIMLAHGVSIYYLEDPRALMHASHLVRPTILVLVPRLLEKLRNKIINKIRDSGYLLSRVGGWALRLADSEESSAWMSIQRWIADKLIYRAFRKALGGHVRVMISGGAKLNAHLNHFFVNMGFPIYEGWGMTEGCPLSVNTLACRKIGTVGPPLDGVEVRVSSEKELLVRGANVMAGYYKDPEETARVLDANGWLHTGDQGAIDSDGCITLIGRVKDLLKTSTGEWVASLPIEQEMEKLPLVDHALVVAEGRPFCSVLLFPDFEILYGLKADYGMTDFSDAEFLSSTRLREQVMRHIHAMNQHVNHWEEVHDYRFVLTALTVESGDLTPTLKIRRDVIMNKYQKLIETMYQREVKL